MQIDSKLIKVAAPDITEVEVDAVREVLLSGNYVSGPKVEEFETRFADWLGVDHAVAVNSGTAALHIALEAIGVKKNDEVVVPPITFFATVSLVLYLGARPVFADIDSADMCLAPSEVRKVITRRTKAILPVHLFGASAKMDEFTELSRKHKIPIVEDCAQAHGTEFDGAKVGGFGAAAAFSFFATKHMTTGEGGIITTNDPHIAEQCRTIRNHGLSGRDEHVRLGFNNRLTEIAAAIGLVQLAKLDRLNAKRIENSEYLRQNLHDLAWAVLPASKSNVKHTYFWCPISVDPAHRKTIDDLKAHLTKYGIGFRHRYKEPLYKQPVLKKMGLDYSKLRLPNAEQMAGRIIGLPNHPNLSRHELDKIIEVLKMF